MYPITIITIGKIKDKNLLNLINDLMKRLKRVEIVELKEVKNSSSIKLQEEEFSLCKKYINSESHSILLNEYGKTESTLDFSDRLKRVEKKIVFFITGPYGPNEEFKSEVDTVLSLSDMTYTHEQALYMLVEQIYRAQCYELGKEYSK